MARWNHNYWVAIVKMLYNIHNIIYVKCKEAIYIFLYFIYEWYINFKMKNTSYVLSYIF